jgi:hypothetical protein
MIPVCQPGSPSLKRVSKDNPFFWFSVWEPRLQWWKQTYCPCNEVTPHCLYSCIVPWLAIVCFDLAQLRTTGFFQLWPCYMKELRTGCKCFSDILPWGHLKTVVFSLIRTVIHSLLLYLHYRDISVWITQLQHFHMVKHMSRKYNFNKRHVLK